MQRLPGRRTARSPCASPSRDEEIDNQTALRLKKKLAEEFREQLTSACPTNEDEAGLRRLAGQIKAKKVVVKLFLRHPLHAKLYLLFRPDPISPIVGFLGSSNLTFAGLSGQGELNVDVLDHDACQKLANGSRIAGTTAGASTSPRNWSQIIEESWAREELIPPYHIYVKIAYHLSQEARAGLTEFQHPAEFRSKLFEFQIAAVKIAAHHLNKRGGVLIGDVVGLGKTLMATALARIFEDDLGLETLIICPKNLVPMWEDYRGAVPASRPRSCRSAGPSRSCRNFAAIGLSSSTRATTSGTARASATGPFRSTSSENDSKCILLSATPYNKTYLDLANQLRLFVPEDRDLGIRPENDAARTGETEFIRRHQCSVRSLAAFEKSDYPDDWRELMRLYLVRRTRTFHQGQLRRDRPGATAASILTFEDGSAAPTFPTACPKTVKFKIDDADPNDQYARLYSRRRRRHHQSSEPAALRPGQLPRFDATRTADSDARARSSRTCPVPESGSWASAARTCSSGWKAAGRLSCSRSSGTSCAITSSFTPSRTTCPCPSAPRTPSCSTPASPTTMTHDLFADDDEDNDDGADQRPRTAAPDGRRLPAARGRNLRRPTRPIEDGGSTGFGQACSSTRLAEDLRR